MAVTEAFSRLTVADAVGQSGPQWATLHEDLPLRAAARALGISGQPALAVIDGARNLVGLFTSTDVLRAYFEGAPPVWSVDRWLSSGMASAPKQLLQRLTAHLSEPLAQVADRMIANGMSGDCTCHHMVVLREQGQQYGVLSALDMVRALIQLERPNCREAAAAKTLCQIMKHRDSILTCPPSSSVKDALRVLLHTRQTSVVVADSSGVHGILTPRKAVQAYACSVPGSSKVVDLSMGLGMRLIAHDMAFEEAVGMMAKRALNHLIVVHTGSSEMVGLLSSLDIVLCTRPRVPLLRPVFSKARPVVGSLMGHGTHPTPVCSAFSTLGAVAELLESAGRTSAVVMPSHGTPSGALTEYDLLRALAAGWPREARVEGWLHARESHEPRLPGHLLILPSTPVTEAAKLMLSASVNGSGPCQNLVVQAGNGYWLGIFSALDVGRALCSLGSRLDEWKAGADQTCVRDVMRQEVPRCSPGDSLTEVLASLADASQSCALVCDGTGLRGVVTPRCAVRVLAEGAPVRSVADWLRRPGADATRCVAPDVRLLDAAALMARHCVHHLVVAEKKDSEPQGVLSSLDLLRGVVSLCCHVPVVSLRSLGICEGPTSCTVGRLASAAPSEASGSGHCSPSVH